MAKAGIANAMIDRAFAGELRFERTVHLPGRAKLARLGAISAL
jgi:hypothetical protein